jgi:hypothetical protein
MPSFKTVFGSFLKTEDLQGKSVRVVVERAELETIKGRDGAADEKKLVLHFVGKDKGLAMNKTRCEQAEAIFGTDDYDEWAGPVMLVPGTTKYQGKTVGCVDLAAVSGGRKQAPVVEPEPEDVDDSSIPF